MRSSEPWSIYSVIIAGRTAITRKGKDLVLDQKSRNGKRESTNANQWIVRTQR